ncbi:MAG: hypothetical protein IJI05_01260, partial [Erysipelotrichaceae bacterium]|nr:hypothetical protein [Erysipelotrichaceae bacterium]
PVYAPEIIMLNVRKRHYCLVESCDRKHIYLYDPNIGTVPVKRVLWRFLWSNYYITLCYNVNDQRRHLWP